MRVLVIGAGAFGLPAAAELAVRGAAVTLIDTFGPANASASSGGASRIWRLAHQDRPRVRLARHAVDAWRRLERDADCQILLTRGLLWRDAGSSKDVAQALAAEDVEHRWVEPNDVGQYFPGLAPTGIAAVFQPEAGTVLADVAMSAQHRRFVTAGGSLILDRVTRVDGSGGEPVVRTAGGLALAADKVIIAAGPWSAPLLADLGHQVKLWPQLEQVTYLEGIPGWEQAPAWFEGDSSAGVSLYGMPTPGLGYKIGLEQSVRPFDPADTDRSPDPALAAEAARRASAAFGVPVTASSAQVCTWTMSADGLFILDTLNDDSVIVACGDSGEGFKFSALMGMILADLALGDTPVASCEMFALSRFGANVSDSPPPLGMARPSALPGGTI